MLTRQRKQSKLAGLSVSLVCLGLIGYFAFHTVNGEHGLRALRRLSGEEVSLTADLERLQRKRTALAHRVSLLKGNAIDPDLVEERAKLMLNLAHPDDIVVLGRGARFGDD